MKSRRRKFGSGRTFNSVAALLLRKIACYTTVLTYVLLPNYSFDLFCPSKFWMVIESHLITVVDGRTFEEMFHSLVPADIRKPGFPIYLQRPDLTRIQHSCPTLPCPGNQKISRGYKEGFAVTLTWINRQGEQGEQGVQQGCGPL